jgi:hypothetical protein
VAEVAGRAIGVGSREEGRCSGKLNVLWRPRRVVVGWWGDGVVLVDRRWHGLVHDG